MFSAKVHSFTSPPSCPPSLHGRYPLRRYYEDSDSCPAPFRTKAGILDSRTCISGHSVSNHAMRPCSGHTSLLRAGLASDLRCSLSAVPRTSYIPSSLVSRIRPYRVRCGGRHWAPQSTDYPFTSSCSPPHLAVTQLLSVTGVKLRQRGTSTLRCMLTFKRTRPGALTGRLTHFPWGHES